MLSNPLYPEKGERARVLLAWDVSNHGSPSFLSHTMAVDRKGVDDLWFKGSSLYPVVRCCRHQVDKIQLLRVYQGESDIG